MTTSEMSSAIQNRLNEPEFRLIGAIHIIHKLFNNQQVTGIQFEDGSQKKFNYQLNGGEWKFIDLSHWYSL